MAENFATKTFNCYCGNQCNFDIDPTNHDFIVLCGNSDGSNATVARYDKHGKFICNMATTADGLNSPVAVVVDGNGRVFVSNQNGNTVSIITKAYTATLLAGDPNQSCVGECTAGKHFLGNFSYRNIASRYHEKDEIIGTIPTFLPAVHSP